jgi:hypothetical protein
VTTSRRWIAPDQRRGAPQAGNGSVHKREKACVTPLRSPARGGESQVGVTVMCRWFPGRFRPEADPYLEDTLLAVLP